MHRILRSCVLDFGLCLYIRSENLISVSEDVSPCWGLSLGRNSCVDPISQLIELLVEALVDASKTEIILFCVQKIFLEAYNLLVFAFQLKGEL